MKKGFIALSLLSTTLSNVAVSQEISKHLYTSENPVPLKRVNPRYPTHAAKHKREGWAKLSFIIEKDGSVSDVLVLGTSGSKDFANASKSAILQWQYQPAFENGEPIQQCVNTVQMNFNMSGGGETGASRRFKRIYKKALAALEEKDFPLVKQLLTEFESFNKMHLSENNYRHLLGADYAKGIEDKELQLFHLQRMSFPDNNKVLLKQKFAILNEKLMLQISLNKLHGAFSTYKSLIKMAEAKPYLDHFTKIINQLEQVIASDRDLIINGDIKGNDYWYRSLVRNEFSIAEINGSLNKLDVRCANKRHVYTIEEDNTWKLPKKWKKCSIYIYGDNNTKFNLIEHPIKS